MRQGRVHNKMLQQLVDEQTFQLRQFNYQLQEEINKRKLLEDKLQTSEAKIRAVFEAMTDIVLVINTQGNQVKDIEVIPTSLNRLYESDTDLIDKTVNFFLRIRQQKLGFKRFGKL